MRRRTLEDADALDLLLDTVCNAFGGIIFIVLLLVLLPTSTRSLSSPPTRQKATSSQLAEIGLLESEIESASRRIQSQQHAAKTLQQDQDPAELARRDELETRRQVLLAQLEAAKLGEQQLDGKIASTEAGIRELKETRARLEAGLLAGKQKAQAKRETRETRLPRVRTVNNKFNIFIAVSGNRVYLVRKPGRTSLSLEGNEKDFSVRRIGDGTEFTPKAGFGSPIADWIRSEEYVGSSRVDLQACKLEYSIVSPK